jgi:hypothetical protein
VTAKKSAEKKPAPAPVTQEFDVLPKDANLFERMLHIMAEVNYLKKDTEVGYGRSSFKGISHDKVAATLRPLFVKYGVMPITGVANHERVDSWEGSTGSKWTNVEASVQVTFVNIHDSKDTVTVQGFGAGIDNSDKGPGKAVSYAVKMIMLKQFLIETGEAEETDSGVVIEVPADSTRNKERAPRKLLQVPDDDEDERDQLPMKSNPPEETKDEPQSHLGKPEGKKISKATASKITKAFGQFDIDADDLQRVAAGVPVEEWTENMKESALQGYNLLVANAKDPETGWTREVFLGQGE